MQKRILSAVGILVIGFVLVATVVAWQMSRMTETIESISSESIPLYRTAQAASLNAQAIHTHIARAFMAKNEDDLKESIAQADLLSAQLIENAAEMTRAEFSPTLKLRGAFAPVVTAETKSALAAATPSEKTSEKSANIPEARASEAPPAEVPTILQLIQNFNALVKEMKDAEEKVQALVKQQLQVAKQLAESREELSKTYRKSFALEKANTGAFNNLSRAVIVVMYSSSTRDLNFVGRAKFNEGLATFNKQPPAEDVKALLDPLEKAFTKTYDLAMQASTNTADYDFFAQKAAAAQRVADQLSSSARHEFEHSQNTLGSEAFTTRILSLSVTAGSVLIGAVLAFLIARNLSKQIQSIANCLSRSVDTAASAANQMQSGSTALASDASSQAAAVEEAEASIQSVSSTTHKNAQTAASAQSKARDTRIAVERAHQDMQTMKSAVQAIQSANGDIAKIAKAIDAIAFQTNMLALNAAVEAARAGQAGAGFAVVANEVRTLASRSAQAAHEAAEKIEHTFQRAEAAVAGVATVESSLNQIQSLSQSMDELCSKIATDSANQTKDIEQVNSTIGQINDITQRNAASSEESAATASEVCREMEELRRSTQELTDVINGKAKKGADKPSVETVVQLFRARKSSPQLVTAAGCKPTQN